MNFVEFDALVKKSELADVPPMAMQIPHEDGTFQTYYRLFREIALNEKKTGVMLELGCFYGTAAAYVCSARATPHIDGHKHVYVGVDLNLNEDGTKREGVFSDPGFIFLEGDSTSKSVFESVKKVADENGGLFFVYQDSSHHYAASVSEWKLYSRLMRPGGIWICDDITPAFKLPSEEKGQVEYFNEIGNFDEWGKPNGLGIKGMMYEKTHTGSIQGVILF